MKIHIRRWDNAKVIYEVEADSIKEAIEIAVKNKISLEYANLSNAYLSNANLSKANFYNADLSNANLSNANLSNANLSKANFYNANFSDANLSDANLYNADLSYANFYNANFSDANLSDANLYNADLSFIHGVIEIKTSTYPIIITKTHVKAGCQYLTHKKALAFTAKQAKEFNIDSQTLTILKGMIKLAIKQLKRQSK